MDELLAIKFAGWHNPEFEIWMYERIRELLITGKTTIPGVVPQSNVIRGLRTIVAQLEQQEVFNHEIRNDVDFIRDRVDETEAKITSVDDHYYTIAGYCGLHKNPLSAPLGEILGKDGIGPEQVQGGRDGNCSRGALWQGAYLPRGCTQGNHRYRWFGLGA